MATEQWDDSQRDSQNPTQHLELVSHTHKYRHICQTHGNPDSLNDGKTILCSIRFLQWLLMHTNSVIIAKKSKEILRRGCLNDVSKLTIYMLLIGRFVLFECQMFILVLVLWPSSFCPNTSKNANIGRNIHSRLPFNHNSIFNLPFIELSQKYILQLNTKPLWSGK